MNLDSRTVTQYKKLDIKYLSKSKIVKGEYSCLEKEGF